MRDFTARARRSRALALLITVLMLASASAFAQSGSEPFWKPAQPQQPQQPQAAPQPASPAAPAPAPAARRPPGAPGAVAPASPVIARVGGRPITQLEFDRLAAPYFQTVRSQLGGNLTGDLQRMATFNVLDELVRREMLALEAQRLKIEPSQADVDGILSMDPSFQVNGKFDPARLAAFKASPTSNYLMVLPKLRELAAMKKVDETLRKRFTPTPAQLRADWETRNAQMRFETLPLLVRDMSLDPESSDSEIAAFYRSHADMFTRRTRVHLRYMRLPLPPAGDSSRAGIEAAALARARSIADSLRAGTLGDSAAGFADSGPFDVPPAMIPGIGRVPGLSDTLIRIDTDSTIRVVGPYTWRDMAIVGTVTDRQARHLAPLREVYGDAKRRADAEKHRLANDAERRAYYEAHRDHWKSARVALTRVVLDPRSVPVPAASPQEVERWYAQNGRTMFPADSTHPAPPPMSDSLRGVVRARLADEQRPRQAAEIMGRLAVAMRTARDVRALARTSGAVPETLTILKYSPPDTLFGPVFVDSLLANGLGASGTVQGPREFNARWVAWRVDAVDTAYVAPYEMVRSRSDVEYADETRRKDEAEGRAWFDQHAGDYRTPEKFAVSYVALHVPPPDSVAVPEAAIRHEYDANPGKYHQEEQVKARHILFMARNATPEVERVAKTRADSLLAAIRKDGGDFGELAKKFSQEPGAAGSGGELGWFGRGRMVKEFETAAFALKPGEVSGVVKTQFGYHIIQLEDRKAAGTKPYADARAEIRLQMAQARGDTATRHAAEALRRKLALGGDANALAAHEGGVISPPSITATEPLPAIGMVEGLNHDLPAMVPGKWAPTVYRAGGTYLLIHLREKIAPHPAGFDDVRAQAIEDAKNVKRRALLDQKVAAIRAALAAGATLDSVAAPFGGLKDSGPVAEGAAYVPGVGTDARVVAHAFGMKPGQVSDTLQVSGGVVWLRPEERKAPDEAAFKASEPQLEAEWVKRKFDEWLEERKKVVPVEILRKDLKGPRPATPRNG